jgi:hypothetical protein
VLLRAREREETDPGDIAEHLLFESRSRHVVAKRLLQIAERYGLLEATDRRYRLTDSGRNAVDTKQIFVPEHGSWTVWASNDPLLAAPILHVEPWAEPTAYEELLGGKRNSVRERAFGRLPRWLRDAVGVVATPIVGGAPLRFDELSIDAEEVDPEATLRAVWNVTDARLRLEGALGGKPVNGVVAAPKIAAAEVWKQLLEGEQLSPQWDEAAHVLRVRFEETIPAERESLVRAVTFRRPDIASVGPFDATTVEGVALRPHSSEDATRWAEWRLRARVHDYATTERFATWSAEAVAPFSEFRVSTPTRQALADAAWRARTDRPTPSAWHLVAAEDWRL